MNRGTLSSIMAMHLALGVSDRGGKDTIIMNGEPGETHAVERRKYQFSEEELAKLATLRGKPKKRYVQELKEKYS